MGLDTALARLGRFGRWQMTTYVLLCLSFCLPASWQLFAIVFIGTTTSHHCRVPVNHSALLPMRDDGLPEQCVMYANLTATNATVQCTDGWQHDLDGFRPNGTIAMEWDLVCDKAYYIETSQTIFGIGNILGAALCTPLGDKFGRKKAFFLCQLLMSAFGLALAFSPTYAFFCIFQFLTGALSQGLIWIGFVMACELFASQMRTTMAPMAYLFWSFGMMSLTLWAYFLRHWRHLQCAISAAGFLGLFYYWACPESLCWLVSRGRINEAMKILRQAAKWNKVPMSETVLSRPDPLSANRGVIAEEKTTIMALFRSPKARRNVLVMFYMVFSNNLMYFGLSLMTGALPGDRYVNFFFVAALEAPATIIATIALRKFGRRWPVSASHIFSAVFLGFSSYFAAVPALNEEANGYLVTCMALVGKFGVASAYVIELIYQQEIYPTPIRATGVGITAAIGLLGSVLAPYSVLVFRLVPWVPGMVFAVLSVLAGLLALLEPETMGRQLPETIQEIEAWTITPKRNNKNRGEGDITESEDNVLFPLDGIAIPMEKSVQDEKMTASDSGCFIPASSSATSLSMDDSVDSTV